MTRIYENFIEKLLYDGSIFNLYYAVKLDKYTLYDFSNFIFRNIVPFPYIWLTIYTKRGSVYLLMKGKDIEETKI